MEHVAEYDEDLKPLFVPFPRISLSSDIADSFLRAVGVFPPYSDSQRTMATQDVRSIITGQSRASLGIGSLLSQQFDCDPRVFTHGGGLLLVKARRGSAFSHLHPGCTLDREFVQSRNLSVSSLADKLGVGLFDLLAFMNGKLSLTLSLAFALASVLGTSPGYWLELHSRYAEACLGREPLSHRQQLLLTCDMTLC